MSSHEPVARAKHNFFDPEISTYSVDLHKIRLPIIVQRMKSQLPIALWLDLHLSLHSPVVHDLGIDSYHHLMISCLYAQMQLRHSARPTRFFSHNPRNCLNFLFTKRWAWPIAVRICPVTTREVPMWEWKCEHTPNNYLAWVRAGPQFTKLPLLIHRHSHW